MIFTIIGILILLYSCFNLKKGFSFYMLFQIIWFPNAKLISVEGFPSIPIYLVMSLAFCFLYLIKKRHKNKILEFPFFVPLLLISISHFITCFYSVTGFGDEFSRALGFVFGSFIEVWLMWRLIETEEEFSFLLKGYTFIFFIAAIYGIYEYTINNNPLVEFKSTLTPQGINLYRVDIFRGYRLMSFFEHPIGAGMNFGLLVVILLIAIIIYKQRNINKTIAFITISLSIVCILLTKMRSGILFAIIAIFSVIKLRKKRTYLLFASSALLFLILLSFSEEYMDVFLSLFSKKAQMNVGGSSIEMRLNQLDAVSNIMKMSPLFGLGERFTEIISNRYIDAALGFESIWFEEMTKRGMVGVVANVILAYYSLIKIPRKYHSIEIFFISLSYWVTYTLTSTPFFRISLYYFALFYCIKNTRVYKTSNQLFKNISKKEK